MDRRDFLKTAVMVAGAGAACAGPARAKQRGSGVETGGRAPAVEPIADYLEKWTPVDGPELDPEKYSLTYDVIHWNGTRTGTIRNPIIGRLSLSRRPDGDGARMKVNQRVEFGGHQNILAADILCVASDPPGRLSSWTLETEGRPGKRQGLVPMKMRDEGRNRGGRIVIETDPCRQEYTAENPVVSQWTVLDAVVAGAADDEVLSLDVLHDLSLFSSGQTLRHAGPVDVPVKGGRTVRMDSYVRTGSGTLPVHYVVDDAGRPQLVTACTVSWGLKALG